MEKAPYYLELNMLQYKVSLFPVYVVLHRSLGLNVIASMISSMKYYVFVHIQRQQEDSRIEATHIHVCNETRQRRSRQKWKLEEQKRSAVGQH